jgi:hypothetical protein
MPRPGAVIVSLNGGVGNQMFQYAAGVALAQQRGVPLQVVPGRALARRALDVPDLVDVPPLSLTPYERFLCGVPGGSFRRLPPPVRRALRAAARRATPYAEINQSLMQMADAPIDRDPNVRYLHLRGLFQHHGYYDSVLDDVSARIVDKLGSHLDRGAGDGVVAVHFRRGDYVLHGYDLPFSFQEAALRAVADRCSVSRVVVMSDDDDFARLAAEQFARGGFAASAVADDPQRSELDDFCALASAQHLVMSNSTFVWWAAVVGDCLRTREDRVVVCPTPWMPLHTAATIPAASLDISRSRWILQSVRP